MRRTKFIYVRLTPKEHRALKVRAIRKGVAVSELVRMILKGITIEDPRGQDWLGEKG